MVVMVSVWTKLAMATTDPRPVLKRFNIYECTNNTTISKVKFDHPVLKDGFFLGLAGTSRPTMHLQQATSSSSSCKLPPNVLFRARPSTKDNLLTVLFHQVATQDNDPHQNITETLTSGESLNVSDTQLDNSTEELRRNQNGDKEKENSQQNIVTCSFTVDASVSLQSGYGFISCRDDPGSSEELWRQWLQAVTAVEEEIAQGKTKTVIGVVIGTSVVAVLFVVCVLCRLRSARSSTQYHSGRRPSATSLRTGSTRDHHSSRT